MPASRKLNYKHCNKNPVNKTSLAADTKKVPSVLMAVMFIRLANKTNRTTLLSLCWDRIPTRPMVVKSVYDRIKIKQRSRLLEV